MRTASAIALCCLCAAILITASGCASFGGGLNLTDLNVSSFMPPAHAQVGEWLAMQFAQPIAERYLYPYVQGRLIDAVDIFEVGLGWGMGLGAQASAGVGFVGIEQGSYSWIGVFGADQVGDVQDDRYYCLGLPFSLAMSGKALAGGQSSSVPLTSRLAGAFILLFGFEDGIGGPMGASSGYQTVGPVGNSPYGAWMSSSGPVGGSVALGPLAVIARVRIGAAVNFVTGFLGFHLFTQPFSAQQP